MRLFIDDSGDIDEAQDNDAYDRFIADDYGLCGGGFKTTGLFSGVGGWVTTSLI